MPTPLSKYRENQSLAKIDVYAYNIYSVYINYFCIQYSCCQIATANTSIPLCTEILVSCITNIAELSLSTCAGTLVRNLKI